VAAIDAVSSGEQVDTPAAVGVALIVTGVSCLAVVSELSVH